MALIDVALGCNHTVALDSRGKVWTWGSNNRHLQLGRSLGESLDPQIVALPENVIWQRVNMSRRQAYLKMNSHRLFAIRLHPAGLIAQCVEFTVMGPCAYTYGGAPTWAPQHAAQPSRYSPASCRHCHQEREYRKSGAAPSSLWCAPKVDSYGRVVGMSMVIEVIISCIH